MASIQLNIPDNVATRVLDAIAANGHYRASEHGTKGQFAKARLIDWILSEIKQHEGRMLWLV